MSEFTCWNGHEMTGLRCKICGSGLHRTDGLTMAQQIAEEEQQEYEEDLRTVNCTSEMDIAEKNRQKEGEGK